jgi:hypothetical protein
MSKQLLLVDATVDRDRQQMPALLLLGEAQRPLVSSFEVLNYVLRPTGTDQPVAHPWHSCLLPCQRAIGHRARRPSEWPTAVAFDTRRIQYHANSTNAFILHGW